MELQGRTGEGSVTDLTGSFKFFTVNCLLMQWTGLIGALGQWVDASLILIVLNGMANGMILSFNLTGKSHDTIIRLVIRVALQRYRKISATRSVLRFVSLN